MSGKEAVRSSYSPRVLAHRVIQIGRHYALPITRVAFSPDGKMVACNSPDMAILLWDTATGERLRIIKTFEGHRDIFTRLAFSPDGKMVASAWIRTVSLWDVATGKKLRILEAFEGHWDTFIGLAFSPDGKMVACNSPDMTILLWDAATGERLRRLESPSDWRSGPVFSPDIRLAFSPDSKTVASVWGDVIVLWDVATGERLRIFETFEGRRDIFTGLVFSPDGKMVACNSLGMAILLWDAATGERLRILEGPSYWGSGLAFSPDSKMVASTLMHTVGLWDVATGEKLRIFEGHRGTVTGLAFSPDGKMVASISRDIILLWDAATGERLLRLEGRWDMVAGLAFSPDGKMITSISEDAVNLWDVEVDIVDAKAEDEDGSRLQSSLSKSDLVSETGMPLTIPMAPASTPYPPREEEQTFYYHGLPSRPKLVARSSGFRWQRQFMDQHEIRKVLKNIGDHPIVDQYNDNVIKDIINALGDLPWNAIDVLRIGYEDLTKYPIILWVSVQPGSTTWDKGYQCAINCTAVLREHNIPDVECEIKEAEIFNLAGPRLLRLEPQDSCIYGRLPFTQTLGQSLAGIDTTRREGSMGLYLKQNNADKYFGLTCRHVAFLETNNKTYSWKNNNQPRQRMIQPGDTTFEKLEKGNSDYTKYWSDQVKHQRNLETVIQELKSLQEIKEFLESFAEPDNRVIGHTFFSPSHSLHHLKGWLRDWALIELDVKKFGDKPPTNIVYIGDISDTIKEKLNARPPGFHFKMGGNKSLKLQDYIRENEIMHPTMKDENDEPCLIVGKHGRSTGMTWGTANEVMSVTRTFSAMISKEWCILSSISTPFSKKGDSGSAIFDLKGRIGGIMSSGMGLTDSVDTTYATPMDWLLSDINEQLKEPIHIC